MRALLIVFAKEFRENLRDRRTLVSALLFGPLFGPLLFGLMVSRMLNQSVAESDEPVRITLSGSEYAPGLTRYLQAQGVRLTLATLSENEARSSVRRGGAQVVLIIPTDYGSRFSAATPAPVLLVADSADSQARKSADRARLILSSYASSIAQLRLQVRGVNPLLAVPVAVNEVDVATPAARAVVVLGFMTYFVLFAVLMGGLYLAIDSTAGERERGFRRRVPLRAVGKTGHERQFRGGHGTDSVCHLPALRTPGCRPHDLGRLVHAQLPRGPDLPRQRAVGADAAHCLRQHLFPENQGFFDVHPLLEPALAHDQRAQGRTGRRARRVGVCRGIAGGGHGPDGADRPPLAARNHARIVDPTLLNRL
jgi:hypothetical protein